jgi:outer membrane biosynthesis protein TonB
VIDRSEGAGLTVALAGHVVLFGLLSVGFLATPNPAKLKSVPIEVSLSDDIGMETSAPVISHEELAAKKSPVEAPGEPDVAPPEPAVEPQPIAKPQPTPPKPVPAPDAKPAPPAKPVTAAPAKTPAKPTNKPVRPTGNLDGLDIGKSNNKTNSTAITPPASSASATEVASFRSLIARQIQPCANRQVTPGPGAENIKILLTVNFNRDGSLAGNPVITGVQGNDGGNSRYVERVKDLAVATFKGCSPIHGLPDALYDVPRGWKSLPFSYKLPG